MEQELLDPAVFGVIGGTHKPWPPAPARSRFLDSFVTTVSD